MVSERERKALEDIERTIRAGDPDIARCFDDAFERSAPVWPYTTVIVIGVILLVASIVLAVPATMLFGLLLTVSGIGARLSCAHERDGHS